MCKLIKKIKKKSITGYKAAYKINGKYYSPWTGVNYQLGKVKGTKKPLKYAEETASFILKPGDDFNNPTYFGKTAVFEEKEGAKKEVKNHKVFEKYDSDDSEHSCIILKMIISGEIWETKYDKDYKTFAGTNIDLIEEV